MNTKQSSSIRRSFDNLFPFFRSLNQGNEKKTPIKNALYNAGVIAAGAIFVGVILILGPFFKPLLWSFLFGALLYPAKKKLATALNDWLDTVELENKHLLVGIVIAPFERLLALGQYISLWLISHLKILLIGGGILLSLRLTITFAPKELIFTLWNIILWQHEFFSSLISCLNVTLLFVVIGSYTFTVYIYWRPELTIRFMIVGQFLWIIIIGYLCSFLGALQLPIFVMTMIYGFIAIIYNFNKFENMNFVEKWKNFINNKSFKLNECKRNCDDSEQLSSESAISEENPNKMKLNEIKNKMHLNVPTISSSTETVKKMPNEIESLESDTYFRILFYACAATVLWKHTWIMTLALFPISFYLFKLITAKVVDVFLLDEKLTQFETIFKIWLFPRHSALLPLCLPGVIQINANIHKFICNKLKSYVDDISAIVMIGLLIVFLIFISVFSFVQIYSETIAVARLGGNLINRTLQHRPDMIDLLPIDMQSMDNIIDNAYKYGRGHIENYVDGIFNDTDPTQAKKLKCQILSVWDRLIQSWMDRNNEDGTVGPRVSLDSLHATIDEIVVNPVTKAGIIGWAKTNFGMLVEVADSLWILLRTNLSLLASAVGTLFSVVLGGGHAVIKFVFHTIIFFTTLYYLLQSSQDRYSPIAINMNLPWGCQVAQILEDSISSVLIATLKLALFHGLFTWLTHTIFGAHIVYLPAVLASILAAAPFLETYWCSVPAFLDLWLSQDRFYLGVLLVMIHFIVPSNFNPIIHSEIKGGGHPYLTGLSIAGGMYLIGLEGAVLGPLLLCILVVLFNVTMNTLKESPNAPTRQSSLDTTTNEVYSPETTTATNCRYTPFHEISQ